MGAVTDQVKRHVPGSYRAMVSTPNQYFGITDLQGVADYVKFRLFGTAVAPAAEASLYDPLLVNFLGKLTTLQFIPAAVDYWGDQLISESTTGTSENVTYPDRREGLWKVFERLRAEVKEDYNAMAETYGFKIYGTGSSVPAVSYGDGGRGVLVTGDPQCFDFVDYVFGDSGLVWSNR